MSDRGDPAPAGTDSAAGENLRAADLHQVWRSLPVASINDIIGGGWCLILAPHPDDESLGCGGLIAACCAIGRPPLVTILTDGAGSHPNSRSFPPNRLRAERQHEARDAVARLGLPPERIRFLDQPDTAAPTAGPAFDGVVDTLAELACREPGCTAILTSWMHDPHCDHAAASLIATAVAERCDISLIAYPVWGWTLPPDAPVPPPASRGWRFDIDAFLPVKRQAIHAHRTQYRGLITDDPTGFQLPSALLAAFDTPFETFLQP